jgi:antitoxin MazE
MPISHIVKWGNSLAVRIPKTIAKQADLKEGDAVVVKVAERCIELCRVARTLTLEKLVAQITPENRYEETDWGPERGREKVEW